jgi:hypothetical protein
MSPPLNRSFEIDIRIARGNAIGALPLFAGVFDYLKAGEELRSALWEGPDRVVFSPAHGG